MFATQTNLILDRGFGLEVAGISRVNDCSHHAAVSIFAAGMLRFAGRNSRNRFSAACRPSNLANRKICSSPLGPPHWPFSVPAQQFSSGDWLARTGCICYFAFVLLIQSRCLQSSLEGQASIEGHAFHWPSMRPLALDGSLAWTGRICHPPRILPAEKRCQALRVPA
jgi:hypothetical protein